MKRTAFSLIFACCMLAMAAQDVVKVKYQGAKPTITHFVQALVNTRAKAEVIDCDEAGNAFDRAWNRHCKGLPQEKGETFTVDQKNGYVRYESKHEEHTLVIEMCYWNEADGKHRLVAYNVASYFNGKYSTGQYDGLDFYRYNNATRTMTRTQDVGFEVEYYSEDGARVSYDLPRSGKNITKKSWYDDGRIVSNTLKWQGRRFTR
ncbi:MAG: hypothetical protein Q4B68_06795 [Bacteroidales bacterium]|nr:hypothetical protein [Bacteroidales bacterium]